MPEETCPTCKGTGTKPGTFDTDCDTCSGTGTVVTK